STTGVSTSERLMDPASQQPSPPSATTEEAGPNPPGRASLGAALESKEPQRRPFADYRRFIRDHYDGLPGALTGVTGLVTGHEALAGRLIGPAGFDVRG